MQRLQRNMSVCQQTRALLRKNLLIKWRMKMQTFLEWILSLLFVFVVYMVSMMAASLPDPEVPRGFLGRLDDPAYNVTGMTVAYTPMTSSTRQIMNKVASDSVMKGIKTEVMEDEKAIEAAWILNDKIIGVVFKDDFSYHLRFSHMDVIAPNEHFGHLDICYNFSSDSCHSPMYWYKGFLSLQSSIDAAIIEMTTNHSVWEEMKSISGVRMGSPALIPTVTLDYSFIIITIAMCFSPFMHFLSISLTREKRKLKELKKTMGLQDAAFWLSWSLLYAVCVLITASLLTAVMVAGYFHTSSFFPVLLLFFLYGLASIHLCFMLSSLLKKPKITSSIGFLLTFFSACLSFMTLMERLPAPLEWTLGLLSPFAFTKGISKILHLEKYGIGFYFSNITEESYAVFRAYILLIFDSVLYMLLAIYFDKVLPDKYGMKYPPLFCLKPSYWCKSRRSYAGKRLETDQNHERIFNDSMEPVPAEFDGKEAIRLNNIKKTYKTKDKKIEALRGLFLNIYEGQITALLGHSGAGKTTLLNILGGLSQPSDGSATIYKYRLSEMEDLEEMRAILGVCPQFNVQFEVLTVKENLRVFAEIKGIRSIEVEHEVQKVLKQLDIISIQDTQANKLSGGQKRTLSLAIAMLGDPQVLILDEPTAGLDPRSRHHVWTLLKERRAGRVTLFSTQFMDEADILADRKAFISHGRIKCVGSSLFLKKKWGIGYHLRMHVNEFCDSESISSLVRKYIPDATFTRQSETELSYTLPLENVDKFPDLFCGLDSRSDQGIINYGISMTTLEDVFLKLESEAAIDHEDYGVFGEAQADEERETFSADEMEQGLLSLSDTGKATVSGIALWRQQVCTMARIRFLKLKHEDKTFRSILLLCGFFLLPLAIQFIILALWERLNSWELSSDLYFTPPGKQPHKEVTSLLVLNETGSSIQDFIHGLKTQNIMLEIATGENITEKLIHNGAIQVSCENQSYRFTIMCSTEIINCFPVLVNVISNALLRTLNSTAQIRIWSHRFFHEVHPVYWDYYISNYIAFMLLLLPGFPPHFAMNSIQDYKIKARSQLWTSGLVPSAYWCGQALVDIPLFLILLFSMFGILFAMRYRISMSAIEALALITGITGYGAAMVLFIYLIAFIFRKRCNNCDFWSFILIAVTLVIFIIRGFTEIASTHRIFHYIMSMLTPLYSLIGVVNISMKILVEEEVFSFKGNWNDIFISVFAPYIHCVLFIFLLRWLEKKYGKAVMREDPIFRIHPRKEINHQNPEAPEEEEEDVQAERTRVREAIDSENQEEKPVIIVNDLRKEYKDKKASSVFKKKKKVATKNVSFCVKKGEVLGLLGPNGAGKSTTISMITGETTLTAGQVLMKAKGPAASQLRESSTGFLGHCPQDNRLWPNLTVQEHLEVYAAVKGMRKEDAAVTIKRIAKALELQDHLKKATRKLSAGITRKVCFALSMLGNPTVLLLDEPSTGMDPKGKSHVWKAIHAALKNKEQGAILTTHYMEEAEAVCDRVAIMVCGKLCCIGAVQYLKSKFGKGYLLEIKVKDPAQIDRLHMAILRIFPHADRQERVSFLLVYKIPMQDALPLSQAFSRLEAAKQTFSLEEYSFSLITLEQVFLELTREQEMDNFDMALEGTFKWKKLQQEDLLTILNNSLIQLASKPSCRETRRVFSQTLPRMLPGHQREISVCQQTGALLLKNILVKWRTKKQSLQELLLSLTIPLLLYFHISIGWYRQYPATPSTELGRLDEFNATGYAVQYTPITHTTRQIMQHVTTDSFMKDVHIVEKNNGEEPELESTNMTFFEIIEVNFSDAFSYELTSLTSSEFNLQKDNLDHNSDSCFDSVLSDHVTCAVTERWTLGFVPLQANIDAAIIQIASNHSVMEELRSVTAVQMRLPPIRVIRNISYDFLVVCIAMAFSPLIYFMSLNVAKERKKFKELMKMMGLQDLAFWFSWGLLYAGYILIVTILLTLIMKSHEFIYQTSHSVMFFLFYLYGISLMSLTFLLSSLLKKPMLVGIVGFFFTLSFGSLGLAVLYNHVPEPLKWALGLFCPFAFTDGFVRIVHLEENVKGVDFSDFLEDSYPMLAIFLLLAFDTLLYLMLAIYFDKVLPDKYGTHHSRLFFLKPSYWFKERKNRVSNDVLEHEEYSDQAFDDHVEQMPPEFRGKEAISINNIKKTYKGKDKIVNALKGLLLNVYEGQITALLGHSGAGKSTLLNILSGLCPPSEGSAIIYEYNVSEMEDLEEIRKITGVCPQFNIQFEVLTVKENLRFFAKIKGIRPKEVEREVQKVLTMLKIKDIQDCQASSLSSGQKRKLTLGIALLGDPQVLLLDEPTAGLDPSSRYHIWSLLKEHKANRVTLFSTQLMEEADILADRKAFISHGRLTCVGSSLFLKRKWGIGYHLSLHINDSCDSEKMTSLVKQHIPNAKLSVQSHEELIYMLPFENVEKFPELFCDLDTHACQGILSYGISMTTLADVFLTLEEEAAIDQTDYGVFGEEQADEERETFSPDEMEQGLLSLSDIGKATVSGIALWRQQVWAMARIRFLKLKHESQTLRSILLVCGLPILLCLISRILVERYTDLTIKISPQMYFLQPGQEHYRTRHTSLLVLNDTEPSKFCLGSHIEDFINAVKSQNIMLEIANGENISESREYNGAIKVSLVDKHFRFSLMCHAKRINCFPVLMNIISNALLRNLNSTRHIQVTSLMPSVLPSAYLVEFLWFGIVFMSVFTSGLPPHFAMSSIGDYKIKAHSQLWTSGMIPSAYWCGQALVDIPLYCVLLFTMIGIIFLIYYKSSLTPGLLALPMIVSIFGCAASIVVLTYVISFAFRKGKRHADLWAFIFIFVSFVFNGISYLLYVDFFATIFTTLIPIYTLAGCLKIIVEVAEDNLFPPPEEFEDWVMSRAHLLVSLAPYLHCIIFIFILRCLEWKYGRKTMREDPIFRISPRKEIFRQNPEEPEGEDEDVQAERMRVGSAMTCRNQEERPILTVNSLRKEYRDKKASSIFNRRKKAATRNVSFCVNKGEVLGILGPNGAGKSTTLKVIIGDTSPTAGQVLMKGMDAADSQPGEDTTDFLGYCPQENPLWPHLTVQEHLEVYAAVKGMRKEDAAVTIRRIVNALKLQKHLQKPAKKLPAGISRKVCFALSMLGKPMVVLLDGLSTGLDPVGQHQVWTAVRAAVKNKKQGAILTTHHMKEAEAVCDRVAIMVSGKLRSIGTIQYLKSKFGKGYLLEIKVRAPEQVDLIHQEILRIFPLAACQERYSSLMVYRIPTENVQSLAQAFFNLEKAKHTFNLEEYSLSQSTLEQVFLELSREQEKEDFDMALDSTTEWKLIRHDDH
ncbi:uncharacterized protein [Emydura macquarii macquarii]|uniref:uncharacterized protein n=1 Tax=Emydura macquarii macquarii TaxID=1129001 RepID=UPI00352A0720